MLQVVAVMGHRPGHLFHPSEGIGSGVFFGHGPIFRDLNFVMDIDAAKRILAMNLPLVLIPYDAAKSVMITGPDLDELSGQNAVLRHVVETARGWLVNMGSPEWGRGSGRTARAFAVANRV